MPDLTPERDKIKPGDEFVDRRAEERDKERRNETKSNSPKPPYTPTFLRQPTKSEQRPPVLHSSPSQNDSYHAEKSVLRVESSVSSEEGGDANEEGVEEGA